MKKVIQPMNIKMNEGLRFQPVASFPIEGCDPLLPYMVPQGSFKASWVKRVEKTYPKMPREFHYAVTTYSIHQLYKEDAERLIQTMNSLTNVEEDIEPKPLEPCFFGSFEEE